MAPRHSVAEPVGEARGSPPHGSTASARLPAFLNTPGMPPAVTQGRLCLFPGARFPQLGGLFSTPSLVSPPRSALISAHTAESQLCPARPGSIPGPCWCRRAGAVPCPPLSCKRDPEGSKQPDRGQVLCWERTLLTAIPTAALVGLTPPGRSSGRAEGFNTPPALPLGAQSQEG